MELDRIWASEKEGPYGTMLGPEQGVSKFAAGDGVDGIGRLTFPD